MGRRLRRIGLLHVDSRLLGRNDSSCVLALMTPADPTCYSLIHGADELARTHHLGRGAVLGMLTKTSCALFARRQNGKAKRIG